MEIFGVSRYIAVPIAGLVVWVLVLRGTYRQVEKVFLALCTFYLAYVFSAILAKPDWLRAARHTVIPTVQFNAGYLLMLTALVGTTIAPWQFFYLQASFVEKRVGPRQYAQARARRDRRQHQLAWSSCSSSSCARRRRCTFPAIATSPTPPTPRAPWCRWPAAGPRMLFAFGLLNASLFAASILPLSTAHVICEGLGFEAGIDHKFSEAPIFYWLYTILIVVGGGLILIPHAPLWRILVLSQVANGVWLPIVLIFMILLINRKDLMGDQVNSRTFNVIAWVTSIAMIALTLVLIYFGIFHPSSAPGAGL